MASDEFQTFCSLSLQDLGERKELHPKRESHVFIGREVPLSWKTCRVLFLFFGLASRKKFITG